MAPDAPIMGTATPGLKTQKVAAPAMAQKAKKSRKRTVPMRLATAPPKATSQAALSPRCTQSPCTKAWVRNDVTAATSPPGSIPARPE